MRKARQSPPKLRSVRNSGCWRSRLPKPPGAGARLSSGLVALSNNSIVWLNSLRSSTTSLINSSGKLWVSMQKRAVLSISSASSASGSAPNWRASPFSVCAGKTKAVVFCSRMACFDLRDRLDAIFAEIAQDADESGAKLGAAPLKMHPIDDVRAVVAQCPAPRRPGSGAVPQGSFIGQMVKLRFIAGRRRTDFSGRAGSAAAAPRRSSGRGASNSSDSGDRIRAIGRPGCRR